MYWNGGLGETDSGYGLMLAVKGMVGLRGYRGINAATLGGAYASKEYPPGLFTLPVSSGTTASRNIIQDYTYKGKIGRNVVLYQSVPFLFWFDWCVVLSESRWNLLHPHVLRRHRPDDESCLKAFRYNESEMNKNSNIDSVMLEERKADRFGGERRRYGVKKNSSPHQCQFKL